MQTEIIEDTLTTEPSDQLEVYNYFVSSVYTINKPEFLDILKEVSHDKISKIPEDQQGYGLCHTDNLLDDERTTQFAEYIGSTAWNILKGQGFFMDNKHVFFESMWCQEYKKNAYMPQHVHPNNGAQLIGFYFLETPKKCPRVIIHDPRPGKVQIGFDETNPNDVTNATSMVNFEPTPGMLFFTNSWLPHSFTQNLSSKAFKFIHFNLGIRYAVENNSCELPDAEVI